MASRKTYFGIGWPQDAPDPDSGAVNKVEADDRSSPTVVDDEKVAEGLRQLRSWYQDDAAKNDAAPDPAAPVPAPAAASGKVGARPTAVGHATAPPAQVTQRPFAPDPMRATMYGHDVHKFDLDAAQAAAADSEPTRVAPSTALIVASPAEAYAPAPAEAIPQPATGRPTSDPFQLARFGHGEAERLPRSARRSGAFQPTGRPAARAPWASRIMFVVGLAALAIAVVTWFQSSGGSEAPAAAPPAPTAQAPAAIPATPPAAIPSPPPAPAAVPEQAAAPARSPDRTTIPTAPAPIPAAAPAAPKTEQLRLSSPSAPARAHRHHEPKPALAEPTEAEEQALPAARNKEAREPGEAKTHVTERETAEAKAAEAKAPRETKDPADTKETKESKELKEPPKDLKETKALREPREPRESKGTRARAGDPDSTLPPSLD